MADKTEKELLEEISSNQGITLKEAKAAVAASAENKKIAEDLTAQVAALNIEMKAKDATIGDILGEVKELKASKGRIIVTASDKRKVWLGDAIAETIGRHAKEIKASEQGLIVGGMSVMANADVPIALETKTVGVIQSANLTGTGNNYISYLDWQMGMEPTDQFRFRSLFRSIQSETDFVKI